MERKLFLGANTANGYKGTEGQLIDTYNLRELFILKGGSGFGKSTFMQKFADEFVRSGERKDSIDYYYCSDDASSLDAVIIKRLGVGMVDGSAPHILDLQYPGLVDNIVDLGKFVDPSKVTTCKSAIDSLNRDKIENNVFAQRAINQVAAIQSAQHTDPKEMKRIYEEIKAFLERVGVARDKNSVKAFARSVTGDGIIDHRNTFARRPGTQFSFSCSDRVADWVFAKLHDEYGGYAFMNFLRPNLLEGVSIGGYVFGQQLNIEKEARPMINNAIGALRKANNARVKIEQEYAGAVDFAGVDAMFESIIAPYREKKLGQIAVGRGAVKHMEVAEC